MKRINIIKIIESEGYKVLESEHRYEKQWVLVRPEPANESLPEEFQAWVQLVFNGYGDLVITLSPMTKEEKFVYDCFEYQYEPVGRPKSVAFDEIQNLKNKGMTQEQTARELNVSLSTVRRNWKY